MTSFVLSFARRRRRARVQHWAVLAAVTAAGVAVGLSTGRNAPLQLSRTFAYLGLAPWSSGRSVTWRITASGANPLTAAMSNGTSKTSHTTGSAPRACSCELFPGDPVITNDHMGYTDGEWDISGSENTGGAG
jgi:hypothetical protein